MRVADARPEASGRTTSARTTPACRRSSWLCYPAENNRGLRHILAIFAEIGSVQREKMTLNQCHGRCRQRANLAFAFDLPRWALGGHRSNRPARSLSRKRWRDLYREEDDRRAPELA